ncbi:MAG: 23S rRNA (adenine(2503)-C(2))-methyltransferase RlmN [Acidiferrobacterales bacterium]|nr:23S rRNA (adenine(2503)-C(2))-methyltransferase RlmN [Acidiferrobacterales bacterium]
MSELQTNLMGLDRQAMENYFLALGEKTFRASQVMKWIHQVGVSEFSQMTNLSKSLREQLAQKAVISVPEIISDNLSEDGTRKWLLRVPGKSAIEMVFIPEQSRGTLCVSSQVGCTLNCSFCATGKQGYNRDLTAAEIIGQVWLAKHLLAEQYQTDKRIVSNVVMMGMGEPLMNFDNVVAAMDIMQDDFCFGLSKRRITLSTAGVVPMIDKLKEVCPVSLAVSLHAPNDELRNELVPLNKKYPIKQLLEACNRYVVDTARARITFEYVMLQGINDELEHAHQLAKLMKTVPGKVNLIPFNSFEGIDYTRSSNSRINRFRDILHNNNVIVTVRRTRGDDIEAACGQLAGDVMDRTKRAEKFRQKRAEKIQ